LAYIGKQPVVGNFQICDAISVVNGQAAYTMQVGSVNVSPESANHMIVSLNGTIQKPNSSYTVSGSTITFSSNLATGDVIDFIQILGDVLSIGTPSDGTVTTAKIVDGAVTSAKLDSGVALGKVLQVITATNTVERTTTSNSFVTASNTLTVNITPSSSSNKILLLGSFPMHINGSASLGVHTIYRDSTNLGQTNFGFGYVYSSNANPVSTNANVFLDSPSTTSEITYQVYIRATNNTVFISPNASTSTLTALEIGT